MALIRPRRCPLPYPQLLLDMVYTPSAPSLSSCSALPSSSSPTAAVAAPIYRLRSHALLYRRVAVHGSIVVVASQQRNIRCHFLLPLLVATNNSAAADRHCPSHPRCRYIQLLTTSLPPATVISFPSLLSMLFPDQQITPLGDLGDVDQPHHRYFFFTAGIDNNHRNYLPPSSAPSTPSHCSPATIVVAAFPFPLSTTASPLSPDAHPPLICCSDQHCL
ncbi:hypothetical protein BHM03_00052130 [Ensete ventricosum]|nr:hypothetical protein BHM03_00052130 [Ensete ventricosum]